MNSGMKPRRRKAGLQASLAVCLAFVLFISLNGCLVKRSAPTLPRPEPGHLGWLAGQSMLRQAEGYIGQVTQTERIWLHPGTTSRVDTLLLAAPNWLNASPDNSQRTGKFFGDLSRSISAFPGQGIGGLYLGQITEPQNYLLGDESQPALSASLEIDPSLGGNRDYDALLAKAAQAQVQLGAELPWAATSRGPDFTLQARHVTGYEGLYAMLPVPREFWKILPPASSEWECHPLSSSAVEELAAAGLIPVALRRDGFNDGVRRGWASTGEVQGADGQPRRWIYRYEKTPENPVFLWQDPAGLARKIFAAAIIARTGLDGITLAGLHVDAFMGMEPDASIDNQDNGAIYAPGLDVIKELSAQIHRYGGWCMLADSVEETLLRSSLETGCDFCRDDVSVALFRLAYISGNADPLARLLRERKAVGIEEKRLARGFRAEPNNRRLLAGWIGASPMQGESSSLKDTEKLEPMLAAWNAGLPGLLFNEFYGLSDSINNNADEKSEKDTSFVDIQKARFEYKLAAGNIYSILHPSKSALAVLVEAPTHSFWLTAVNFGSKPEKIVFKLPDAFKRVKDAMTGVADPERLELDGREGSLYLEGGEIRTIIFLN